MPSPAQLTAVKQRPHPENGRQQQVAMSESVVRHHGREETVTGHNEARPSASTARWAALVIGAVELVDVMPVSVRPGMKWHGARALDPHTHSEVVPGEEPKKCGGC